MLAAAVVPHPPLLVPALAGGGAGLVAPLLAACDKAVAGLLAHRPATVVLIGSGESTGIRSTRATGTLAGFGTETGPVGSGTVGSGTVGLEALGAGTVATLPLSLMIGRWLLERAGWAGDLVLQEIAAGTSVEECERLGARLAAASAADSVWLALGDGSTRRGPRSPGHDHPRAAEFDAEVARAFATADPGALLALDPELATLLGAVGRPVWQVLAGAVAAAPGWRAIEATVHYDDAPFGVQYLVADWSPRS